MPAQVRPCSRVDAHPTVVPAGTLIIPVRLLGHQPGGVMC
ncbi:MAG: hypothetical protein AVDCRST_MAG36-2299 [uncultured Nocardioidaceae bacterium]|uniref:Uncharacterized protein n=1 Tax=uncultured Nocardioidaceae bacterium TaxID=253824 RepID=A0A6J4MCX6_9ACTN|nr:MAG: hypothetical protein AVDCRST_MAG36-2299 [uncultured Nocardioidaceae bacterium]